MRGGRQMILLAGAAGQLGSAVYRVLRKEYGTDFRCIDIKSDKLEAYKQEGVETFAIDLAKGEGLDEPLKGVKAVISVVGLQKETPELTYMDVDYGANKNLLDASIKEGVEHFSYVSALQTAKDAPRKVHRAKWLMEEELRKSPIKYTIFRPSGFFTDFIYYFGKKCKEEDTFTIIGDGNMKIQPINIDELAYCLVKAHQTPAAYNKVFPVGGPEVITLNELIEFYAMFFNKEIKIRHIPMWLMKFLATITFNKLISKDFLVRLETDSVCDISEIKEAFQIEFTSLKDYIRNFDWSKV
ncbi:MAG: NAD-dependent epimerase/dehydratase family protein [Candidatus Schekmanbacteria bacterium]|nr:MAG: NAD-dependent epimerase/dehydratase family protein [Candidatus Schekmanbacteria bacterium]